MELKSISFSNKQFDGFALIFIEINHLFLVGAITTVTKSLVLVIKSMPIVKKKKTTFE